MIVGILLSIHKFEGIFMGWSAAESEVGASASGCRLDVSLLLLALQELHLLLAVAGVRPNCRLLLLVELWVDVIHVNSDLLVKFEKRHVSCVFVIEIIYNCVLLLRTQLISVTQEFADVFVGKHAVLVTVHFPEQFEVV